MGAMAAGAAMAVLPALVSAFQKPNTTHFAQQLTPMISGQSQSQQALLDLIAKSPPQFTPISIHDLNNLVSQQGLINAFKSKMMEREVDPNMAQMRENSDKDLNESYQGALNGDLPIGVQNALVRAGLGQAMAGGSRISATSLGKGSAEKVFGMGSMDYLNQLRNLVMQKTMATPKPQGAVDAGSAAGVFASNFKDRDALNNQFQQQILQATGQANDNLSALGQSLAQSATREGMNNAAIKNAKQGQFLSTLSGGAAAGGKLAMM